MNKIAKSNKVRNKDDENLFELEQIFKRKEYEFDFTDAKQKQIISTKIKKQKNKELFLNIKRKLLSKPNVIFFIFFVFILPIIYTSANIKPEQIYVKSIDETLSEISLNTQAQVKIEPETVNKQFTQDEINLMLNNAIKAQYANIEIIDEINKFKTIINKNKWSFYCFIIKF